ncbi:MAG TPA: tetratricopeptide repeat protein [Myxococcales bacterium]|nr:tetratricopeptide repeat protein [Myxococcales bacterium]
MISWIRVALLVGAAVSCAGPQLMSKSEGAVERGRRQLDAGRYEAAQREFEAALETAPRDLRAWHGLLDSARRRGALADVAPRIEQRARDGPGEASTWFALGMLRSAQRRDEDAAVAFSRAASIAPDEAEVEYRWGAALLGAGRAAEARTPLSRAVELAPNDASYRVAYAACLFAAGERHEAMEALTKVPRLSPSSADAERAIRLARALTDPFRDLGAEERSVIEPALRDLERDASRPGAESIDFVVARFPNLAGGHLLAALGAERWGDSPRAFTELRKAAALAPELPQPHAYLARLLVRERPEAAAREYAEAVMRNPLDPAVLRELGELELERLGRPLPAVDSLGRAAELTPDDAALQVLAARAELVAGSLGAARERLARCVRRWRRDARTLLRLGAAAYDARARIAGEERRSVMTQCIDHVLEALAEVEPDSAAAKGLRRAAHEG